MFATNLTVVYRRRKVFVATLATVAVSVLLPSSILSAGSDNPSLMVETAGAEPGTRLCAQRERDVSHEQIYGNPGSLDANVKAGLARNVQAHREEEPGLI